MVGRDAELARAVQALRSPPSVVMIEGEAGLGKSRLVAELAKDRSMLPRRFLIGRCRPIREPFPLGQVLEAVRQLREALATTGLSPVVGVLGSWLPELADVLPEPRPRCRTGLPSDTGCSALSLRCSRQAGRRCWSSKTCTGPTS